MLTYCIVATTLLPTDYHCLASRKNHKELSINRDALLAFKRRRTMHLQCVRVVTHGLLLAHFTPTPFARRRFVATRLKSRALFVCVECGVIDVRLRMSLRLVKRSLCAHLHTSPPLAKSSYTLFHHVRAAIDLERDFLCKLLVCNRVRSLSIRGR